MSGTSGRGTAKFQMAKGSGTRRSGGRAVKGDGLTWGDLALCPKGRRVARAERSEKSAEAKCADGAEQGRPRTSEASDDAKG